MDAARLLSFTDTVRASRRIVTKLPRSKLRRQRKERGLHMGEIARTNPADARRAVLAGRALLVCAYDSEEKFGQMQLEGSVSLGQFRERLPTLDKAQEVVFYCA